MRHEATSTSTGPRTSLSYLTKENGRIPKAFRTCPFCNGGGLVEHDKLGREPSQSPASDGEVAAIRRLYEAGMSGPRIARLFERVSYSAIKRYIRGDRRAVKLSPGTQAGERVQRPRHERG